MESNKIISIVIGLTIMIITIAVVLVPVIEDAKIISGNPTEINNTAQRYNLDFCHGDTTIVIQKVDGVLSVTTNGETVPLGSVANANIIVSDAVSCNPNSGGTLVAMNFADGTNQSVSGTNAARLVFESGMLTAFYNDVQIYQGAYTWLYSLSENGIYSPHSSNTSYISTLSDITGSGTITNSTTSAKILYSFHDGIVKGTEGYTFTMAYNLELASGTTDIYVISDIVITATDDTGAYSVNVSRPVVLHTIEGHSTSGASYEVLNIIPIIMILAVFVSCIALVRVRND